MTRWQTKRGKDDDGSSIADVYNVVVSYTIQNLLQLWSTHNRMGGLMSKKLRSLFYANKEVRIIMSGEWV